MFQSNKKLIPTKKYTLIWNVEEILKVIYGKERSTFIRTLPKLYRNKSLIKLIPYFSISNQFLKIPLYAEQTRYCVISSVKKIPHR